MRTANLALFFTLLIPLPILAATPVRHYSYSGNDPSQWTSSVLSRAEAAAAADFTVFPCEASSCTMGQVISDLEGNTYATGSRQFPYQTTYGPSQLSDVFLVKLDPAGATLFLATFSGKGNDQGRAIALDAAGNIYLGGSTSSPNFPIRNAIQPERGRGGGFLMKLSPDGSQLIYSTYFGGTSDVSYVKAIAADSAGALYVTGQTGAREFPASPGMPAGAITGTGPGGILGAFVAKLSAAGDRILYSGRISGNSLACTGGSSCFLSIRSTSGEAIGLDSQGNAYVMGNANVTDLPTTTGALRSTGIGAWVARINAAGTRMDYLTYLTNARYGSGSFVSAATAGTGLAVDAAGNAYVTGATSDPRFPATTGAVQASYHGPQDPPAIGPAPPSDAFVAKLNPQGSAVVYATFLGGSGVDGGTAIALDSTGAAYVAGVTDSSDFLAAQGGDFLAVVNPAGASLSASSRYPKGSLSQSVAVDTARRVHAASPTGMVSLLDLAAPPATRLFGVSSAAGGALGAVAAPGELISLFGSRLGPAEPSTAQPGSDGRMPTALAGTQVFFNGAAAPLLYVSADQINAVAPFGLTPETPVVIRVVTASGTFEILGRTVVARPGIFGLGTAAALNQDGTVNSESHPAKPGSVVSIWVTGTGAISPAPPDGQITTEARETYCCSINTFYSGDKADVLYSGAAPGMVAGVTQINFRVPADLMIAGPFLLPITLTVSTSNLPPPVSSAIFVAP